MNNKQPWGKGKKYKSAGEYMMSRDANKETYKAFKSLCKLMKQRYKDFYKAMESK